MGDFLLVHDESGKAYYERIMFLIILLSVVGVLSYVSINVNIVLAIVIALCGASVLLVFVAYFIHTNPPIESSGTETKDNP